MMNSKGFRMRRDHEAKQELGIKSKEQRPESSPERPLSEQRPADQQPVASRPSLITRIWRAIAR